MDYGISISWLCLYSMLHLTRSLMPLKLKVLFKFIIMLIHVLWIREWTHNQSMLSHHHTFNFFTDDADETVELTTIPSSSRSVDAVGKYLETKEDYNKTKFRQTGWSCSLVDLNFTRHYRRKQPFMSSYQFLIKLRNIIVIPTNVSQGKSSSFS